MSIVESTYSVVRYPELTVDHKVDQREYIANHSKSIRKCLKCNYQYENWK